MYLFLEDFWLLFINVIKTKKEESSITIVYILY